MADINPKQQAQELIKQSNHILLVSGHNLNDDQYCSILAMKDILGKIGKSAIAISGSNLPKTKQCFPSNSIIDNFDGVRDLVIDIDTDAAIIDTVKYDLVKDKLRITVRAKEGALKTSAVHGDYGAYSFDLVIVIGVADFANIDHFVTKDPSIFDGIHLINIDYHRTNSSFGSVNIVDTNASSVCEMMIALAESLGYGPLGSEIASMLFAGIIANTNRFANNNTTAKAMTMAAQMLAAGAKHNEIIKVLSGSDNNKNNNQSQNQSQQHPTNTTNKSNKTFRQNESRNSIKNSDLEHKSDTVGGSTNSKADNSSAHNSKKPITVENEETNSNANISKITSKMPGHNTSSTILSEAMGLEDYYQDNMADTAITLEQEMQQSAPIVSPVVNANSDDKQPSIDRSDIGLDISSSDLDQFLSLKTK